MNTLAGMSKREPKYTQNVFREGTQLGRFGVLSFQMILIRQLKRTLKAVKFSARVCKTLLYDQAFFASVKDGAVRDREKNYLPWFTYPAIEALKNWDLSDKRVFEYGSGYSTLFWASRAREVVTVEHNRAWYERIAGLAPENVRLILAPIEKDEYHPSPELREQFKAYAGAIEGRFHIIVIDGYASLASVTNVRRRPFLILIPTASSFWITPTGYPQALCSYAEQG